MLILTNKRYVKYFDLKEPSNSIDVVLLSICKIQGLFVGGGLSLPLKKSMFDQYEGYDVDRAGSLLIRAFREGKLGNITLDDCSEEALDNWFVDGKFEGSDFVNNLK